MELKPCPFCGGEGYLNIHRFAGLNNTYGVKCDGCDCQTYQFFENERDAENAWNRRADDD